MPGKGKTGVPDAGHPRFTDILLVERVARCVFDAADGAFRRPRHLVSLTFGLQFLVACRLADAFLNVALELVPGTLNSIFVNHEVLP